MTSILGFGNGTIAAMILDEILLPTCVDIIVNVNKGNQLANLTQILRNVYNNVMLTQAL